jgi:FG-GAP-like repeat
MKILAAAKFVPPCLLLCFALITCGGGGGSSTGSNESGGNGGPVNVAGNWQFTTNSTTFGTQDTVAGSLLQSGSAISGDLFIFNSPCALQGTAYPLTGTESANSISAMLDEAGQQVTISGNVSSDGNSISGTYQAPAGGCTNGDAGTVSGQRYAALSGTYRGAFQSNNISLSPFNVSAAITQDSQGNLTAVATITGSFCFTSINLSGRIAGSILALTGTDSAGNTLAIAGTTNVEGTTLSVNYQVSAGGCSGDSGGGTLTNSGSSAVTITIAPTSETLLVNATAQFTATVSNTTDNSVAWEVNNVSGGNSSIGTISADGLYTAPAVVPSSATVVVTAVSEADTTKTASALVTIQGTTLWTGGPMVNLPITNQCFTGDFNGDGRSDIACYMGNGSSGTNAGVWNVALSTGNGWQSQLWSGGPGPAIPVNGQCFVGDFDGDGKSDLACYTGGSGNWNVALSTGNGWQLPAQYWNGGPDPALPITNTCFTGDFNADGKTDLLCYVPSTGNFNVALSTGSGWNSGLWAGGPLFVPLSTQCFTGDLNGDGKTDLTEYSGGSGIWGATISTGTDFDGSLWSGGPEPSLPVSAQCFATDFNGDHKTDVACYLGNGASGPNAGVWNLGLSTGSGWNLESWANGQGPAIPITGQCFTGDFNGDGKADLACFTGFAGGIWGVSLSTGSGWQSASWNGGPAPIQEWTETPVGGQCFTGDFNGDGKTDLACYSGGGAWQVALSSGSGWY